MKTPIRALMLAFFLLPAPARAAMDGSEAAMPSRDPVLERVSAATAKKDWPAAQGILRDAVQKSPQNAEYHNLYAYALRQGPSPDMALVFRHYNEALRIDPKHRGAHEYIGEAYLMIGNLAKAKEHLGVLDRLCFFPCSEYTELKRAIADYEAKRK